MEAVSAQSAPRRFTPFRGLTWVAAMLFCLNAMVDVLLFHGVAVSSSRKAQQPVSWAATPYTSIRAFSGARPAKPAKLTWSNWYPKDLAISRDGFHRFMREDERAGQEFARKYFKP